MRRIAPHRRSSSNLSNTPDKSVFDRLTASHRGHRKISQTVRAAPKALMEEILAVLFPEHSRRPKMAGADYFEARRVGLPTDSGHLTQCRRILLGALEALDTAASSSLRQNQIDGFIQALPRLQTMMKDDAEAILKDDPAAKNVRDVILTYPGWAAVAIHRIAHELHRQGVETFPRMLSEHAHERYQIDIHPGAQIGHRFSIDHGTGVVIGETAEVGNDVSIFHNVTLGAKRVARDMKGQKRHPNVGDGVTIYANASILGPVKIGHHSVIGGGTCVTQDIPDNVKVYQENGQILHKARLRSFAS